MGAKCPGTRCLQSFQVSSPVCKYSQIPRMLSLEERVEAGEAKVNTDGRAVTLSNHSVTGINNILTTALVPRVAVLIEILCNNDLQMHRNLDNNQCYNWPKTVLG